MSSELIRLLVDSLCECGDRLTRQRAAILAFKSNENFNEFYLTGISVGCDNILKQLETWRSKFQDSAGCAVADTSMGKKVIDDDIKRTDWIKELLGDIEGRLETAAATTSISSSESNTILDDTSKDLKKIGDLISQSESLENLADQASKEKLIRQAQRRIQDNKVLFEQRIRELRTDQREQSFSVLHKGCVEFDKLNWFWSKIPRPREMTRPRDTTREPGSFDGVLINQAHIDKARAALLQFREAWLTVHPMGSEYEPVDGPSLDILPQMPAIACVLYACNRHILFNKFVASEIKDSAILEGNQEVFAQRVLEALKDREEAAKVVGQFSRVQPRSWLPGSNLSLVSSEPLPLCRRRTVRERPGIGVYEVVSAWDAGLRYALKVVRTTNVEDRQRRDLINEIINLRHLGQEDHGHHIVKCVKTYTRGPKQEEVGMLLMPLANGDLNDLLNRCWQDEAYRRSHRLALLRACGCLSYSLAYLHNVKFLRHRDIKPHNVLCYRSDPSAQLEFLWADFGLAMVLRESGLSGDPLTGFGATPEYEAPEIDPQSSSFHTRASDIFALGCMLLEIVCVITKPNTRMPEQILLRSDCWENGRYYKHHLPNLNSWISITEERVKRDKVLVKILQLARNMIRENASERPKIADVVLGLWNLKLGTAVDRPFCTRCMDRLRIDTSSKKPHTEIFKHQQRPMIENGRLPLRAYRSNAS